MRKRVIKLLKSFYGVTDKQDLHVFYSEEFWTRLDEILVRPEFPFLRELSISSDVSMEEPRRQDFGEIKELIRVRMPSLYKQGMLTVACRETTLSMY